MGRKLYKMGRAILFCLLVFFMLLQLNRIFIRKSLERPWDMSNKIGGFYNSVDDYDIYFLGTSHSYCSFNPLALYENTGMKSYVLATQKQPLGATYYYMKDAIKRREPKYVVVDVFSCLLKGEADEGVVHSYTDDMPLSFNKLAMIYRVVPRGMKAEALFPLIKYHDRWGELKPKDYHTRYEDYEDPYRGYVALAGHSEKFQEDLTGESKKNIAPAISDEVKNYLLSMGEYCTRRGIQLVLVKTPTWEEESYSDRLKELEVFIKHQGFAYIDFNPSKDAMNIKPEDYYDGYHLNTVGVEKFNTYLTDLMKEKGMVNDGVKDNRWLVEREKQKQEFENFAQ
ncbi:hypothetical protein PEPNEM18_01099 [Aedoeadaptatus nemausensis]|uniref:SGNH/GDSL hydrolase family protein n=1 Tax=Aedoeadaptatus nemausensis TaxID=2582829 RepID=A0A6V6Y473_9FIRM|nr:hypothetical protein [Peptoniphilus nemausensis]CAC9931809.1 hypothetical protein PEPNEM18_01099 [Peptoniphilus nemausensis]